MTMDLPPAIANEIRRRMRDPKRVVDGGKSLTVSGSIGYECCICPDGDSYMSLDPYFLGFPTDAPWVKDRSRRAQLFVLVSGRDYFPDLLSLLPMRPSGVPVCPECRDGWLHVEPNLKFICSHCGGLGWIEEAG